MNQIKLKRIGSEINQILCEICLEKGKVIPAEDVHHKDSFLNYEGQERLYKAFDFTNL